MLLSAGCTFNAPPVVAPLGRLPDPLPVVWAPYDPTGVQGGIRVQGGSLSDPPLELRLLAPGATLIAAGPMAPTHPGDPGLCGQPVGAATGDLPLSAKLLGEFGEDWPLGYSLEIKVGATWRPGAPTRAGCRLSG